MGNIRENKGFELKRFGHVEKCHVIIFTKWAIGPSIVKRAIRSCVTAYPTDPVKDC
jgi:hypothetical protein